MNKHFEHMKTKANRALWAAGGLCRKNWGLKPKRMQYIITSILLPRITYGCLVFWHRFADLLGNKGRTNQLRSLQRRALMTVTGVSRSTPTLPLMALMNNLPWEVALERRAVEAHMRLKRNGAWKESRVCSGHGTIEKLAEELGLKLNLEDVAPKWRNKREFELSTGIKLGVGTVGRGQVFVDASVKGDEALVGWWEPRHNKTGIYGRLKYSCSSSTAEMIAIKEAAISLIKEKFFVGSCLYIRCRNEFSGAAPVQTAVISLMSFLLILGSFENLLSPNPLIIFFDIL